MFKDLIALHFSKNKKDQYHCPITYKVFTNSSFIVAIATSGNVYSMEAVNELNLKQKNMKDLIDDSSFKKSDIITIQVELLSYSADIDGWRTHKINSNFFRIFLTVIFSLLLVFGLHFQLLIRIR